MANAEAKKMERKDWWAIGISLLTFAISLAYTFRATEYGPLFGSPAPAFAIGDRISVSNQLDGVVFTLPFEARNDGTRPFTIGNVKAVVEYAGQEHQLITRAFQRADGGPWIAAGNKMVGPHENWQVNLSLIKKLEWADIERSANLNFSLSHDIQDQYLKKPNPTASYRLSNKRLLDDIEKELWEHAKWLDAGEYKLGVTIYDEKGAPLNTESFTFHLSTQQLTGLKKYQPRSYEFPDVIAGNMFFTFSASAYLNGASALGSR